MVEGKRKKIERKRKNLMRGHLEKVLEIQKDLDRKMSFYEQKAEVEEYQNFWHDIRSKNLENIKVISRYMVTKCNR